MTATAGPWSVKGIDPKARELAKDLARRSGMTLGEWLNQMITEGDAEDDEAEPECAAAPAPRAHSREIRLSSDAELRRVARALDALTSRVEAAEHRSTLAISGIDQSVMGVLSRIEGVERDRNSVAARFDGELDEVKAAQAKVADRIRRLSDEEAPKLEAMRALEGALGKIAEKLYDSDAKTKAGLDDVRQDVAHAVRRVDRVESRIEAEPAERLVDAVVAKLGERMAAAESRTAEAMRGLEASFAGLDQRLAASEISNQEVSRFEKLASDLSDKVEANRTELTERLSAAADGKLDRMEATLRELAGHVEQGERRSAHAIDRMGREVMRIAQTLGDRVASVEARTADAAQQMGGEMARIADAMENRMGRADQVQAEALEKLGGEIARIAERLADRIANAERRSAAAMDDVGEQLGRVTERITERNQTAHNELSERMRASEERTAKLLEDARETIDRRLVEAQRRNTLEQVAETARRTADAEEAASIPAADVVHDPFSADPFAALEATAPARRASPAPAPVAAEEPFTGFGGGRYEGFGAEVAEPEPFVAPVAATPEPSPFADPIFTEPRTTRDVVAAARAAARQASDKPEPQRIRGREALAAGLAGSMPAPALEPLEKEKGAFSFSLPKRKKKDPALTLKTMVAASGTAAAISVMLAGGVLYVSSETPHGDHTDHSGPAPTAARNEEPKPAGAATIPGAAGGTGVSDTSADAGAKPDTLAVALAPAPGETTGLRLPENPKAKLPTTTTTAPAAAPIGGATPLEGRPLYNTAIGRLQNGDVNGMEDLKKAANLGFAPAQFYLAKLYEQGGSGIKKDLTEARRWTERAAQGGDAKAMHNLALYAFNGEGGAPDPAEAVKWFKKAADQGVVDSQFNLARLYEDGGHGVTQNKAEAYKWYLIAGNAGDPGARVAAAKLKAELPADQTAAAERTAMAYHPTKLDTAKQ